MITACHIICNKLKRWKDRCDALLQNSEHAEEWSRIKNEVQKAQDLTDMIKELRKNLTNSNSKS